MDTIVWVAWDDVRPFASAPWLINAMQYASTIIVFAGVQRWLMRRWLRVQPPGWLGCSIAGALAGAAGYILFRSAVPAPYEFWQYMRYSPPPEPFTCSPKTSTLA
ncbi:MAG: hypothetical protein OXE95_05735 [Chloroflexi bacterium]|nr:hypothetical protein [Chloroflexota bacterium]MCY4247063.1 hypothetical protein [Chloroflexota bacterium]